MWQKKIFTDDLRELHRRGWYLVDELSDTAKWAAYSLARGAAIMGVEPHQLWFEDFAGWIQHNRRSESVYNYDGSYWYISSSQKNAVA